jgi:chitinase
MKYTRLPRLLSSSIILLLLMGYLPACRMISKPPKFRVVGYAIAGIDVGAIQFDKLTHINYAFLIPNSDGTFAPIGNPSELREIVEKAHNAGVKVLISVGGWGRDEEFETLAADPTVCSNFVTELSKFVEEFKMDGADIDWEFPNREASSDNFLALIQELRNAMPKKLVTIAVVAQGSSGEGVPAQAFELLDFVNIMAYDKVGTFHSSYEYADEALKYWLGRGLPASKAVLGLPFYSRPIYKPYKAIVEKDPQAANVDVFKILSTMVNYNGIPTIQKKTELAMQLGSGIMIWALNYDSSDGKSLLNAIDQVVKTKGP